MRPSPSTTRMPSAVDSSVAASTEFASRRSATAATRSVMSCPVATSPSTVGSSSRFVNVSANGTVPPDACRKRTSIVTGAGARAGLDVLHVAQRVARARRGRARRSRRRAAGASSHSWSSPRIRVEAARRRLDDAVARQQHRHRRRVLHQRTEPRDLVARDFPAAAFGQVAGAEHEVVAERRADHLDQAPAVGAADAELERASRPLWPARW